MLAIVVVVAVLGAAPARAAAPVEAGKVFVGPEGEEVALVPLTPRESKKFLVRVKGTGSEFDERVFPHEAKDWSSSSTVQVNYSTQWQGRGFSTLVVRGSRYELYLPGRRDRAIALRFDEERSKKLKSEEVYSQYQKLEKDGTLAKLMAFDRKGEVAGHDGSFAEQLKALNTACGSAVTAAIDWSTIDDELLKTYSISSFCETPLNSLRALCDVSDEAKRTVQAKVKQLDCRFGPALDTRIEATRVLWTTAKDAANQDEYATRFFKKNL
ncbi:hypothetical protein P2318_09390 [Myxococcaceae bacterium GXIMD 01537]